MWMFVIVKWELDWSGALRNMPVTATPWTAHVAQRSEHGI